MSDNVNQNLMDLAAELMNGALDVAGTEQEITLLQNAAEVFQKMLMFVEY